MSCGVSVGGRRVRGIDDERTKDPRVIETTKRRESDQGSHRRREHGGSIDSVSEFGGPDRAGEMHQLQKFNYTCAPGSLIPSSTLNWHRLTDYNPIFCIYFVEESFLTSPSLHFSIFWQGISGFFPSMPGLRLHISNCSEYGHSREYFRTTQLD